MMTSPTEKTITARSPWYTERQLWGVLFLVLCCYLPRLTELTVRGEESRRGRIAWEMAESGDWIVPRIQGEPVYYRPPLQNWSIALLGKATGRIDEFALRFPTFIAIFLTTALIYAYARSFMSAHGAFAAGMVYVTFGQVLELGRLGETEGIFTLFVAGSLFVWKLLLNRSVPASIIWIAGYSLAALATLTKGPQGPLYFVAPVTLYLLLTKQWRLLFSGAHLLGIAAFVALVAAWQIPFAYQVGAERSWNIYFRDVGPRFNQLGVSTVFSHMLTFPLELLFGSLLPWSFLLACFLSKSFRSRLGTLRDDCLFCLVSILVTFPSVWLPPGASLRYYMPLFPAFAVLIGVVFERVESVYEEGNRLRFLLTGFWRLLSVAVGGTAVFIAALSWIDPSAEWSQAIWLTPILLAVGIIVSILLWRGSSYTTAFRFQTNLTVVAWFLAFFYCSVVPNIRNKISLHAESDIARLRSTLPPGTRLNSLGIVHHLFLFHLRDRVNLLSPPEEIVASPPTGSYFCMQTWNGVIPSLPFQWERIATVNCDRNLRPNPIDEVVIGRVISPQLTTAGE